MLRSIVVDVFTDTPLEGNPAAVVTDAHGIPAERMQRIAREFNLSETVFVFPAQDGGDARVRIFTPSVELPFAGHPVLGAAFVLGEPAAMQRIRLETGVGVVPVEFAPENGRIVSCSIRQPVPSWELYEHAGERVPGLGVGSRGSQVEADRSGPRHVYVELASEQDRAALQPHMGALAALPATGVACFAGPASRWKARYFGPAFGVPEDPATGSAAG